MKYRSTSISFLRIAAVCAALFTGSNAFAVILVNLTFDQNSVQLGTTGTFTISGSATSGGSTSSNGWQTYSNGAPGNLVQWLNVFVVTESLPVGVTIGSQTFNPSMVGSNLVNLGGSNNFRLASPSTNYGFSDVLQIGNGTTDQISGTFILSGSETGIDSLTVADFNMNIGNVTVTASAVPEPATYGVLAGAAVLGLACIRRRRTA
ncbi:PEP-CTERM sorting domain-containing protein [Rariglobus hedericola]|uniref:PEP-CTERM sorting domain-containing protein n=1 Tax=Rariglobus hedericola TaxID=2597822 RepID=A0A556QN39_9BACT|nr:PEP-CTERM sorting domain-containing protein [Rariglobus hedericola]TSJ78068.1 PEP-CTERM sorting domain-containing protein [Rariglobus hedericola]